MVDDKQQPIGATKAFSAMLFGGLGGAMIMAASAPRKPMPLPLLSRFPPNSMPNCRYWASMEMAPPMVAATVMVSVSRFLMWASSCATTPAISSRDSRSSRPVEPATAEFSGLRPVAKAFGCAFWMT